MPSKSLPSSPSLDHLKYQAKDLLNAHTAKSPEALARIRAFHPKFAGKKDHEVQAGRFSLSDAQLIVAREYGFESWPKLKHHVELASRTNAQAAIPATAPAPSPRDSADYLENLARDLVAAYESGDAAAIQRLNEHYGQSFTHGDVRAAVWHNVNKVRQAQGRPGCFTLPDAQELIAQQAGFGNWMAFVNSGGTPPVAAPYAIDGKRISPRRNLSDKDWDTLIAIMKERRITALDAGGQMTDAVLKRIADLDQLTRLELGSSQQLTDDGLQHLARMPQLRDLDLSNYPGSRITDRGLEVLRQLPELRAFQICWQPGITDAGVANLRSCHHLESVDLLGTRTGDGAIQALTGKRHLRRFKTGRLVTDAGIPVLHQFPVFKTWHGGDIDYSLTSADAEPNHLLLDGPFSNNGLASIAGLNGVFGLSFFWHVSALTADGLQPLGELPHLGFLGCQGKLCNNDAMRHIAAMPRLRMLMGQGTVADDDGFETLSRSQTIEYIWGRECPNLGGRGFAALAAMPALRGLAVSCKNVDDAGLSALPRFPALKELMPMDVPDEGYRHIGRCEQLESLVLMYCRETSDTATGHIAGLSRLKKYFASYTKITDRSMEILSRMHSLEQISFYGCPDVTDAGVVALARLPHLRELTVSGPKITSACAAAFPAHVRVNYSI
jgi:hypothetical protein